MRRINRQKLKQIGVVLSSLVMSNKEINSEELKNLFGSINEIYEELGTPEYGYYLYQVYHSMPDYIIKLLEDNSLHIIVAENRDAIEKIYQGLYPGKDEFEKIDTITIADMIIAFVEGCIDNDEQFDSNSYLYTNYTKEQWEKTYLKYIMYHQVGHLIDIYYDNISKRDTLLAYCYSKEKRFFTILQSNFMGTEIKTDKQNEISEYFASAFAAYMMHNNYLKKICPQTYKYINDFINTKIRNSTDKKESNQDGFNKNRK